MVFFIFFIVFLSCFLLICFLFFSPSRRRHTRYIGDWSSDVCSSDLFGARLTLNNVPLSNPLLTPLIGTGKDVTGIGGYALDTNGDPKSGLKVTIDGLPATTRSEERRGGQEGSSGGGSRGDEEQTRAS